MRSTGQHGPHIWTIGREGTEVGSDGGEGEGSRGVFFLLLLWDREGVKGDFFLFFFGAMG